MKGTIIWGKTENLNRTHNFNISVQTINGLDILTNLFTLLITIKTKTELEVILKVILKRILYLVLTLDSSLSYRTFIKQYMYHFKIWSFFFTEKAAIMRSTVVNEVLTNAFKIKMKCLTLYNLTLSLHIMIWGFVLSKLLFLFFGISFKLFIPYWYGSNDSMIANPFLFCLPSMKSYYMSSD